MLVILGLWNKLSRLLFCGICFVLCGLVPGGAGAEDGNNYYQSTYVQSQYLSEAESELLMSELKSFCRSKQGKVLSPIQRGLIVDCQTRSVLWKVAFAPDWNFALTEALQYRIYHDFQLGKYEEAPQAGIAIIQSSSKDYKYMVQLEQLVKFYKLPVQLETIRAYGQLQQKNSNRNTVTDEDENESLFGGFKIKIGN